MPLSTFYNMSLKQFFNQFPTEKSCEDFITKETFKKGFHCLVCNEQVKIYKIKSDCKKQKYKCSSCKSKFTILRNTIFEKSNLSLQDWFLAMYLINKSRKGISSVELSKKLEITQKTAWYLLQRIRETYKTKKINLFSGMVELDETYIGGKEKNKHSNKKTRNSQGGNNKEIIIGAVERVTKQVRAKHIQDTQLETIKDFVYKNVDEKSITYTDEARHYTKIEKWHRCSYKAVNHSKGQYVSNEAHTNSIESFWATFKRGYIGVYHQMSKKHLQRYINEFAYRHNNRDSFYINNFFGSQLSYQELING